MALPVTHNAQHSLFFIEGIRLFNEGHYWHAHEQWEQCWLQASGLDATFYKAIIQAAAALVKWQQGNLRGLGRNWAKSRSHLDLLPPSYNGLDLVSLRIQLDAIVAGTRSEPPQLGVVSTTAL